MGPGWVQQRTRYCTARSSPPLPRCTELLGSTLQPCSAGNAALFFKAGGLPSGDPVPDAREGGGGGGGSCLEDVGSVRTGLLCAQC